MDDVQDALRKRYQHLHPLIFARSVERAETNGELFDILEEFPVEYPVVWDDSQRKWVFTEDLTQTQGADKDKTRRKK